ncbi:hypothetical protein ACWEJ6_40400 [Nonomuraea sp. NPDC004702]
MRVIVRGVLLPALAEVARDAPLALENLVAGLIKQGQESGQASLNINAAAEAAFLGAGAEGLQSSVLLRQRLIDDQLARVFTTTNSA